jgi:hypothetical protein
MAGFPPSLLPGLLALPPPPLAPPAPLTELVPPAEIFVLPPEDSSDEDPPLGAEELPLVSLLPPLTDGPPASPTEGLSPIDPELGIIEEVKLSVKPVVADPTVSAMFDMELIIPTVFNTWPWPIFITVGVPIAEPQGELFLNWLNRFSDHV